MNLPSGTITFLFTDLEGSTRLWEEQPDTMRLALARHDALLRAAIETNGGMVFKTIGDAFCAAFSTAPQALEAALTAQQSLHQVKAGVGTDLMLKVRMALHTGTADQRDGDYFGQPLNRVARLLSVGHGGQILLSEAAHAVAGSNLPASSFVLDLGLHRLKDLQKPEHVWQLTCLELPSEFPALRSLSLYDTNLPPQFTSFIGREREVVEVRRLFAATHLLTLTGSGGCGKTRLAMQVAADLLDEFPDGVWLVELAALSDPAMVVHTVANVLTVREVPGHTIIQTLTEHLKARRMVLVLDNCEHLLAACAELASGILRNCPQVSVLATSREGLGIAGEQTYRVPSMSLPDTAQPQTPEALVQSESVRLFVDRAVQGRPDFHITPQNTAVLASICRRLDGIPLAIELAAARVRSLSIEEINSKLDQRFRLLTGGARSALPRQQTLRSLIDWSYVLLNPQEQKLMQRVSVFSGGWTLSAAEVVCSGNEIEEWEIMDLLSSMVDKSLATVDFSGEVARYRLLETVRQYAGDRLLETQDASERRDRHLVYYLDLAERAAPNLTGPGQVEWLATLDAEYDNLRSALDWSLDLPDDGATAVRMGAAMWQFWRMQFKRSEGSSLLDAILNKPAGRVQSTPSAVAAFGAGVLAWHQGDLVRAQTFAEQSLVMFQGLDDQVGVARALNSLGNLMNSAGDPDGALICHEQALSIRRNLDDLQGVATSLNNLATINVHRGNFLAAKSFLEEGLVINRKHGNPWSIAVTLVNLGEVACELGEFEASRGYFAECLAKIRELGWPGIPSLLESLAILAIAEQSPGVAITLFGAAERSREVAEIPLKPNQRDRVEARITAARAVLNNNAAFEEIWQKGRTMTPEEAAHLVLGTRPDA